MSPASNSTFSVFAFKDFRLFVLARFFLTLAIQMQFGTIYLQVYYEYSKNDFIVGLIGLSEAIPFIATSFFSGYFADKHPKKRIIIAATLALLCGTIILFLNAHKNVALFKEIGLGTLFSLVFIFGITRSFLGASIQPLMSKLIPREHYTSSATWNSALWHISAIMGPVLSGIIYGYHNGQNAALCHLIETVSILMALFFIVRIKTIGEPEALTEHQNIMDSIKEGMRFMLKTKMVLSAISLDLFAVLFGGVVAIVPSFTDKILNLGPQAYGLLRTAPAIGAVCMALVLLFKPPAKRAGMALLWSVVAFGLFTILFALCRNFWLAFAMLFLTGAFDNVSVVIRHSILQLMTPDAMRGRVSAINNIFISSSNEIGAFESGLASKLMGLVPSVIFGGTMTILVALGVNRLNPGLKKLDLRKI